MGGILEDITTAEALTPESRRNLIRSTIDRFHEARATIGQTLAAYREAGLGIRVSDFREIFYETARSIVRASRIARLPRNAEITPDMLEPSRYTIRAEYRYVASVVYRDPITNTTFTTSFGIDTDLIGKRSAIEDTILESAEASDSFTGLEVREVRIERAYRR